MDTHQRYWFALYFWVLIAVIIFPLLVKVRAPYGRHTRSGWGKTIDNHLGWLWMEIPALLVFPALVIFGPSEKNWVSWLLVFLWMVHYIHRTLIFPFRLRTRRKKIPLIIVWMGIVFNVVNGFFNGYYLGFINQPQADALQWHFLCGLLLFAAGMVINIITDNKLIQLRRNGNGYSIPQGWLFRYISCPNHFGEIIEWAGFALVAWNFPAFSFALWTITNLLPRALNHHAWYKENFDTYPKERKAVIPLIV